MYQTDHLTLFRKLYEWSNVEATDIDETRYAVAKKLSEVCTVLPFFPLSDSSQAKRGL